MPALRTIALVVLAAWGTAGLAAGLGPIRVQSSLGQSLRASVPVTGGDMAELTSSCIRVRLEQPDGTPMMAVTASVARSGENASILLSTRQSVNEPAAMLSLQVACGASVQRSYQLLLDPVENLAHLPQDDRRTSAGNEPPKRALREQSMVAAAQDGVSLAPARRLAPRKPRIDDASPAILQSPAPRQLPRTPSQHDARKVARSVLKLSGDDEPIDTSATFSPGLKLSDALSESRDTGDAQSAAELKKAYDRFAAVMRDEDPALSSDKQLKDMQAKLQELERQTALLREQGEKQREADQAALASAKRDAAPSGWILALGGLLLAALAAIGWLYRRVRELDRGNPAALWENTVLGQPTESAEWNNTLGVGDTFAATENSVNILTEARSSDWERGLPLDDTLAVNWASQQATMQTASPRAPLMPEADEDDKGIEVTPAAGGKPGQEADTFPWKDLQAPSVIQDAVHLSEASASVGVTASKPVAASASSAMPAAAGKVDTAALPMEVGEISDLMQEAEFWMLLNDPGRAIEMLEPCLQLVKPLSPVPWIYLLDLYRVTGRKEKYQALAARIKKVFNANAPAWDKQDAETAGLSLRDYPHVVQTIEDLWESDEVIPYLESLLVDEREGERTGFDLAVYREIIHLIGVARDPKASRRREQLSFDDPQPRLISQQVNQPFARAGETAAPVISEEEADVFDLAMSHQAVARQVSTKTAVPKATTAAPAAATVAPVAPAFPSLSGSVVAAEEDALDVAQQHDFTGLPEAGQPAAKAEDAERVADMARKLDLVLAYQEIGEHVGARVLLEEVIHGGTPLQVEKARAMLKKLLREIDWQ